MTPTSTGTTASSRPVAGKVVRFLLIALPAGTVALGVIAMILYFVGGSEEDPPRGLYTKEPEVRSLADYAAKLTREPAGVRSVADEVGKRGLGATVSLIRGALGPGNMGYETREESFTAAGHDWVNLWADAMGGRNPTEIVEVRVSYDSKGEGASVEGENFALAAALELAHAFAGTYNRRTVRFLFLGNNAAEDPPEPSGADVYRHQMENRQMKTMTVFDLDAEPFDQFDSPEEAFIRLEDLREDILQAANR